jgi:hypothetical protein
MRQPESAWPMSLLTQTVLVERRLHRYKRHSFGRSPDQTWRSLTLRANVHQRNDARQACHRYTPQTVPLVVATLGRAARDANAERKWGVRLSHRGAKSESRMPAVNAAGCRGPGLNVASFSVQTFPTPLQQQQRVRVCV